MKSFWWGIIIFLFGMWCHVLLQEYKLSPYVFTEPRYMIAVFPGKPLKLQCIEVSNNNKILVDGTFDAESR